MLDFLISNAVAAEDVSTVVEEAAKPGFEGLLFPIALIAIFYFLLIRPQQKRTKEHKKIVSEAKKGDEIVTNGGILGKIIEAGDHFLTLEISNNVTIQVSKNSIASVMPKGTYKSTVKAKK